MQPDALSMMHDGLNGLFQSVPTGGIWPNAVVLSSDGKFLYAPNALTATVSVASLGPDGTIGPLTMFVTPLASVADFALVPSGQFGFALEFAGNKISRHLMDPATGSSATAVDVTSVGAGGRRLRIEPNGRFLYAPSFNGTLYAFSIDGASGALTPVPGSPFAAGNGNVAIAIVEPKP